MAELRYPSETDIQLCLGAQEQAILAVVRGCSWWTKADADRDDTGNVTRVTLTAPRGMESTLRSILDKSFGLVFPPEGGSGVPRARGSGGQFGRQRDR